MIVHLPKKERERKRERDLLTKYPTVYQSTKISKLIDLWRVIIIGSLLL